MFVWGNHSIAMFTAHVLREMGVAYVADLYRILSGSIVLLALGPGASCTRTSMIKNRVARRKPYVYSAFMIVATVSQIIFKKSVWLESR